MKRKNKHWIAIVVVENRRCQVSGEGDNLKTEKWVETTAETICDEHELPTMFASVAEIAKLKRLHILGGNLWWAMNVSTGETQDV